LPFDFLPGGDGDQADKTEAEKAAERVDEWDAGVCSSLMSTPQGRYWVERFLDFCCEDAELYRDDGDALGMAKRDGLAKAGRYVRVQLERHCPDLLLRMVRERRSRFARAQAALAAKEAARRPEVKAGEVSPFEDAADRQAAEFEREEAARRKTETKPKGDG
jgi:hypothetical protein